MKKSNLKHSFIFIYLLILFLSLNSCTSLIKSLVVEQTIPLINSVQKAFFLENDIQAAKISLPATIKLAEGFYHYYPHSPYYSGKLCFLYAAYTFGFVDNSPYDDLEEDYDKKTTKVDHYYQKAFFYGKTSLEKQIPNFFSFLQDSKKRKIILKKIKKKHIETLFWFNFSWAMIIFNDLSNPKKIIQLEIVKDIASTIEKVYPTYLKGINKSIFIAYYGGRTEILGGDYKKCDEYYRQAKEIANNKSIIVNYVYLRFAVTQRIDKSLFEKICKEINNFKLKQEDEILLLNSIIKKKTEQLAQKKYLFF